MSIEYQSDIEFEEEQSNRRTLLRAVLLILLLLILLALLWPVDEAAKKSPRERRLLKYRVSGVEPRVLSDVELAPLKLVNNYRTEHIAIDFDLINDEAPIRSLSYDNFALVVRYGKLERIVRALGASERMVLEEQSLWGKTLEPGKKVPLKLVFKVGEEGRPVAFRVYDADRRVNRYRDFAISVVKRKPQSSQD